jgi:hypothetical protein
MIGRFAAFAVLTSISAADAQVWTLSPAPILRIGDESAPEYQFNRITHLKRLSDNRILATMGPDIRFFDANGKYLSKAGGRGRGPGEYQHISSLIVMPGDSLLTQNIRTVIVLDPQGKFIRQMEPDFAPLATGDWFTEGAVLLPNGNLLAPQYSRAGSNTRSTTLYRPPLRYSLLDIATGKVTPLHTSGGIAQKYVDGRPYSMPFTPHAQAAVGTDLVYVGDNDSTRIHAFTLDGKPLGSITVADKAVPVTTAEMKAYEERAFEQVGQNGVTRQQVELRLANMPRPTRYPYWGTAFVDKTGTLWVSSPMRVDVPMTWTAFDRAGKRVGSITVPRGFTPKDAGADYVLGVQRDDDGVESIVMYSLRRSPK